MDYLHSRARFFLATLPLVAVLILTGSSCAAEYVWVRLAELAFT